MFTDMVNYTALTQADEALALKVLDYHNRLLRSIFPRYRGREVKTMGDGFLVEFASALDATNCALDILGSLHGHNGSVPEAEKVRLRIGIHLGDVVHRGRDVLGDAVNIAAQIEPLAETEGICISAQVFEQVRNKISAQLLPLAVPSHPNLRLPVAVYTILPPWSSPSVSSPPPEMPASRRLAVLPLANISADARDEYLADGLTEELITTVSRIPGLVVISRTSVMQYKNQSKRVDEIGRELHVGSILEGSVRKSGNRVRILVQLIDVATDHHLWTNDFDRELKDIFSVQREIAESVAEALRIRLLEPERAEIARPSTEVSRAHLLYLKGRFHAERMTLEECRVAIGYFKEAIREDPRYPLALAALANTYLDLAFFELAPPAEAFRNAERFAHRAVQLDGSLPEALHALGNAYLFTGRTTEAMRLARRAIELRPNLPETHLWLAGIYSYAGRFEESYEEARRALAIDPLSAPTTQAVAGWYLFSGHPDLGAELYEKVLALDPENALAWANLGYCHVLLGRYKTALQEMRKGIELSRTFNPHFRVDLVYALVRAGDVGEARKVLVELIAHHNKHKAAAYAVAAAYAAVGDRERTFEWLKKAIREHSAHLMALARDPVFEPLRSDTRFRAILKQVGSPPLVRGLNRPARAGRRTGGAPPLP